MRKLLEFLAIFVLVLLIRADYREIVVAQPLPSGLQGAQSTACASPPTTGCAIKASPGNLLNATLTAGSVPGCFYIFNATSVPATGAVTFGNASGNASVAPINAAANTTVGWGPAQPPLYLSVGITIGFSSTCGNTFTQSATAWISAQTQ